MRACLGQRLGRRAGDALALLGLLLVGVAIFRSHLSGAATFVGVSDRVNVPLAMRKFQVDGLQQLGRVPAWNDTMFLGLPVDGSGYLPILNDPLVYLLAAFPVQQLVAVSGWLSFSMLVLTGWSAYLYLKDASGSVLGSFAGSALCALASYNLLRVGQVDPLALSWIPMPLGLLILRRVRAGRTLVCLAVLTAVLALMLLWSFVQEAAYVVMLLGAYAAFRSIQLRSLRPLLVMAGGLLLAAVVAVPRIYPFLVESPRLERTSLYLTICGCEVLRWFDDGIFGRFQEEITQLRNPVNIAEGFQLYTSTFAAFLVLVGVALPRTWRRFGSADVPFHMLWLMAVFAVVFLDPVRYLFYLAFMRADLSHTRFMLVGVLSVGLLTAVLVGEVTRSAAKRLTRRSLVLTAVGSVGVAVVALWAIDRLAESPLTFALGLDRLRSPGRSSHVVPVEAAKVIWSAAVFGAGALAWLALRRGRLRAPAVAEGLLAFSLPALMVVQAFGVADLQVNGPQVWSFPVPFRGQNWMMAPIGAFKPPSPAALCAVRERLDADNFRSVVVMEPGGFPLYGPPLGLELAPHVAATWQLRLIEGYPGMSRAFAGLPWPPGFAYVRSLEVAAGAPLPWELLALLNVKYAVTLNPSLYYNVGTGDAALAREAGPDDLQVAENPLPVVPRQFFARSVRPSSDGAPLLPRDPAQESLVDGLPAARFYAADGAIRARYAQDAIDVELDPSNDERFLVLNEMYHPRWKAFAGGREFPILPTNQVMRGLVVPAGVTRVELRFVLVWWGLGLGR